MPPDDGSVATAMSGPRGAQIERAQRLLATEGSSGASAPACAAAAERVYDKLAGQLAPLLGIAGVRAMFVRSAKLARAELASLVEGAAGLEGVCEDATKLRAFLQALEPTAATRTAAVLFGTFLELIITFIGDRLTVQVLRGAWPAIDETAPRENHK